MRSTTVRAVCIRGAVLGLMSCAFLVAGASWARAQSVTSGSLRGKVTDETGLSLPGVSVTVASAALQSTRTDVSDAEGSYRFADLPVGVYRITFELVGFQQFVRDQVELAANFTATINADMKIGSLEQMVVVSGQSPVVDVTSTTHAVRLTGEFVVEALPGTRTLTDVMAVIPGVQITGRPNMGRGLEAGAGGGRVFGITGQVTPLVEGISFRQDADASGNSPDMGTVSEVAIVSVAGGASQATPGVATNIVVKSGGNEFHGRFEASGQSEKFQSENLTDELRAQGITIGDNLIYNRDLSADLGGRIIRDKLWFYVAEHDFNADSNNLGYSAEPGPDGVYRTADDVPGSNRIYNDNQTAKVTYQLSPNYKLIGFFARYVSWVPERAGTRNLPREAVRSFWYDPTEWKGEMQGTVGSNLVFNVLSGKYSYFADYNAQPDSGATPSRTDRTTQLTLGPAINQDKRPRVNWQTTGTVSYFPTGKLWGQHELKLGFSSYNLWNGTGQPDGKHGNYFLTFDNGVGREFRTYNYPLYPKNRMNEYGVYVEDNWAPIPRLTLNLGLRFDYFNTFIPAQTKEQGQFGSAGTFEQRDVNQWTVPAPRLGASFDMFGTGKTVLKASFGRFNHTPGDAFAQDFNLNTIEQVNYRWLDRNGNGDYDSGEVNLDTNGPDFLSITGAANNVLNPDLELPRTYQTQATLEQQLQSELAVTISYVYLRQSKLFEFVNVLRPYSAWNLPFERVDPGRDGVVGTGDDGQAMTIYDYDPAYRGAAFVQNKHQNRSSERDNTFSTIETTLTKRLSGAGSLKWGAQAAFSATKYNQFAKGIVTSPNDLNFPVNDSWDWNWKLNANAQLPWNLATSVSWIQSKGVVNQRTFIFRALPQSGTLTLPVESFGVVSNPARGVMHLRVSRTWKAWRASSIRGDLDVLNVLNGAPPYAVSAVSGPTYGQWSQILSPRILKGGITVMF